MGVLFNSKVEGFLQTLRSAEYGLPSCFRRIQFHNILLQLLLCCRALPQNAEEKIEIGVYFGE